jgi:hypothetical protein
MVDDDHDLTDSTARRFATPTGQPCPRSLHVDGTVEGAGDCLGCGTCLQFGGLVDPIPS